MGTSIYYAKKNNKRALGVINQNSFRLASDSSENICIG